MKHVPLPFKGAWEAVQIRQCIVISLSRVERDLFIIHTFDKSLAPISVVRIGISTYIKLALEVHEQPFYATQLYTICKLIFIHISKI